MPYIKNKDKMEIALLSKNTVGLIARNPGELNYQITNLIIEYVKYNNLTYQTINDIIGALEGAKLEFYRRVAIPYEDKKIEQNGDVYPKEVL